MEITDELKPVFVLGIPRCPCGSAQFETTFQMLGKGEWLFEWAGCHKCGVSIKITPEFEDYIRKAKWKVREQI